MMKFVLDENLTLPEKDLPENMINARELYFREGIRSWGVEDGKLLELAIKNGYTIITKDKRLAIKTNQKGFDVVFADGRKADRRYFISKEIRIKTKLDLKKLMGDKFFKKRNNLQIKDDLNVLPFYAMGEKNED